MSDLEIELHHLWFEIQQQRWQQISRFLFSYACYREGWVTKSGKPNWEFARDNARSSAAIITRKNSKLIPIVPESDVVGLVKRAANASQLDLAALQNLLDTHLHYVCVSESEIQQLIHAGLGENMPKEWYQSPEDPWSRLKQSGIEIDLV